MRNTASGKHTLPQYSATHFSTESISHYTQYAQPHHVACAAAVVASPIPAGMCAARPAHLWTARSAQLAPWRKLRPVRHRPLRGTYPDARDHKAQNRCRATHGTPSPASAGSPAKAPRATLVLGEISQRRLNAKWGAAGDTRLRPKRWLGADTAPENALTQNGAQPGSPRLRPKGATNVITQSNQDWVICAPAAFLRCGSRFSGSLSGIEP